MTVASLAAWLVSVSLGAGPAPLAPEAAAQPRIEVVPVHVDHASRAVRLRVPFRVRGDRAIARGRVVVSVDAAAAPPLAGLDVLVNDRVVGMVPAGAGGPFAFDVPGEALGDRNALELRLAGMDRACALADAGAWRGLRSASLELRTVSVPLPRDLGVLPLPFVDPEIDRDAEVAMVLPRHGERVLHAAAVVAGWLGIVGGVPIRFRVLEGELPTGPAIALVDGADAARRLGLDPPTRPGVRVLDVAGARLLVVEAQDVAGLEGAAARLAASGRSLAGPSAVLDPAPAAPPAKLYDAPRWTSTDRALRLGTIAGPGALEHAALADGAIEVRFRIPPDLWTWPDDAVRLDLGYAQRVPPGLAPPRLDLDLNGEFLATLPALPPSAEGNAETVARAAVDVPVARLRGFDVLTLHVRYPPSDACATPAEPPSVRIVPDSALHLERYPHFASLPDLSRLLYDGFPFTRVADLGETIAVLPDPPRPDAVAALLSFAAHFASITGRAGTALSITTGDGVGLDARGRDLLAIGLGPRDPLLARARGALPLWPDGASAEVRLPPASSAALDLLAGGRGRRETARARAIVPTLGAFAALEQVESPYDGGRSAVFLVTAGGAGVPSMPEMLGDAESRTRSGDVLVVASDKRWMFRIGPSFGVGEIGAVARARWFLHEHWLLLLPALVLGALLLAIPVRAGLTAQAEARLRHPPPP